jgi:uncharacterized membrane protein YkoI
MASFEQIRPMETGMKAFGAAAALFVFGSPALGDDVCLSREQRQAASSDRKVVPLSAALRAAHGRRGELVNAELCRGRDGLYYLLTLLGRDGKVTRATVDAGTGKLAEHR